MIVDILSLKRNGYLISKLGESEEMFFLSKHLSADNFLSICRNAWRHLI